MTQTIGLTGGIGSGKTTIANYFSSLGIPVYIADLEARKIMQSPEVVEALKNTFGNSIFQDTTLLREKLAEIVFNDPEKLKQLNAIVHPAVKKHYKEWLTAHQSFPFIIYESAILFETGNYADFDRIITVTAPLESRIQRVVERDGTSREQVLKRINTQWTDEQRIAKSDYVIENSTIGGAKKEMEKILKILKIKQKDS